MADKIPAPANLLSPETQPTARPASIVTVYAAADGDGHKQTAAERRVHAARRRAEKSARLAASRAPHVGLEGAD